MATQRQQRVARLLREEISRIIERELRDPRLGLVSITDVEVTPDLRQARCFVSALGDQQAGEESVAVLDRASGFIRGELGRNVQLRYVPEIEFRYDDSLARGMRISQLLDQVIRESPPPADDDDSDRAGDPAA